MQWFQNILFHVSQLLSFSNSADPVVFLGTTDEHRYCKLTQRTQIGAGIVSPVRIEQKARDTCTLCSITKYKNVAIEFSVRNKGIGHV
jgi:hypothetical protein